MTDSKIGPWKTTIVLGLLLIGMFGMAGFVAQDDKDAEIERLREKVAQLEAQLAVLSTTSRYTQAELVQEERLVPDINVMYRSENVEPIFNVLEAESREIFAGRFKLAELVGPPPGAVVADIGAGTGFMSHVFAQQVGPSGKVYAVDINPVMMGRIAENADEAGLTNIEPILCTDKTVELPDESVDIAFICDVYHHFEYPKNSMTSLWHALKPGGQVVVVDFHRIEGVSRPFIMGHVRAGEEVFTQEILDAGFELINDHDVDYLTENYVLRFRKLDGQPEHNEK
ncbi:MAG: methyltransferase domain-containing protein [Planctomycetota bacterium]|nr:methyltransferase domain-containing protein [Planctomycetota bacterium]